MTDKADSEVGARIRALRVERGLSQEALAGTDMSGSYLSRIESGARPAPVRLLEVIAERLGSTVSFLQGGVADDLHDHLALSIAQAEGRVRAGDLSVAAAMLPGLNDAAHALDSERLIAQTQALGARIAEAEGDLQSALSSWSALMERLVVGSDLWFEGAIAVTRLYRQLGDLQRCTEVGERWVIAAQGASLLQTTEGVRLLMTTVPGFIERGDLAHARLLVDQALLLAHAVADPAALAAVYWNGAVLLNEVGDLDAALAMARQASSTLADGSRRRELALVQVLLAHLLTRSDQAAEARELLESAGATLTVVGTAHDVGYLHIEHARAALAGGDPDAASVQLEVALAPNAAISDLQRAEALTMRAETALLGVQGSAASEDLKTAAQLLAGQGSIRMAASAWIQLARLLERTDDLRGCCDAYRAAAACAGVAAPTGSVATGAARITRTSL